MRIKLKQRLKKIKASKKYSLDDKYLSQYSTSDLLKITFKMAKLTVVSFWNKHRLVSRLVVLFLVALMIFSIANQLYTPRSIANDYDITGSIGQLLDDPIDLYAQKLVPDYQSEKIIFNEGYSHTTGESSGDSYAPKIIAEFSTLSEGSVKVTDPVNQVGVSFTPEYPVRNPLKNENRVIYPLIGLDAVKVYTLKGSGVKEDIILRAKPSSDELVFSYRAELEDGLELRLESDGSIGVYGVANELLGNVATGSEQDVELLKKARNNSKKTKFLFRIPAPYVAERTDKLSSAKAWFTVDGSKIMLHASGLSEANYPLSIDPTIYVETAQKLMRGNNETNTDFDVDNELIQKSQTTGARIDAWQGNLDVSQGTWGQSTATAGGYIYRSGGRTGDTKPQIIDQTETQESSGSTNFTMNMPTTRPAGDLYVALMCHDGTGSITPPSGGGWTEYADLREHAAYYKIGTDQGGGNESSSYTWTGSNEKWGGVVMRVTGFDSGDFVSGTAGTSSSASNAVPVFPATTPDAEATLVIRGVGADADEVSGTAWVPSGHTKIASGGPTGGNDCAYATASLDTPPVASVSTGTATLADSSINDTYGASSIAIKPVNVTIATQDTIEWAQFNSSTLAIESPNPGTGACSGWCNESVYDLPEERRAHSMVAYNGYLYVMGGVNDSDARQSTVYIAKLGANGEPSLWHPTDTDKNNWVYWYTDTGLNGGTARSYHASVAYNNRMYILGGQTNASAGGASTVEVADILPNGRLGTWTTTGMQALPSGAGLHMHGVHVYNDTLYTVGGFDGVGTLSGNLRNTVYYSKLNNDGTMNAWQSTEGFATARSSFGGTFSYIWGGYIYMGGGCTAVNGSGYCTSLADDTQIASINADGSLDAWSDLGGLDNTRIGYSLIGWQGGLYRLGGCTSQSATGGGECISTLADVDYGVINPAGEVSTVNISDASGSGNCTGGSPKNCDLPPAGDNAGQGGQMLSSSTILNGYLYVIGGCTDFGCAGSTGNTSYVSIGSDGSLQAPSTCGGTSYGAWCVDSTNRVNGTSGISAAGITTFNNRIYLIGGIDETVTGTQHIYYNSTNTDGSLAGAWSSVTFAAAGMTTGGDETGEKSYTFAYARANPSAASTDPGNLFIIGGCKAVAISPGCSGGSQSYNTSVYKCNITNTGSVDTCSTSGQLQLDVELETETNQGLGLHSGTVYANYIYLVGGFSQNVDDRDTVFYAKFDDNNNIVDVDSGTAILDLATDDWIEAANTLNNGRRRGFAFGYNGHIYAVGGYDADPEVGIIPFIEWSKENVSDGSINSFNVSAVQLNQRWGLSMVVSNSYAYVIGGCDVGASPSDCTSFERSVQTFQLYNNDSGATADFTAQADQTFTADTDRWGASSVVYDGYIYVAGGCVSATDCTNTTNSVQYAPISATDGSIGTWAAGGNLPADRAWGELQVVGGTLYYIGGQDDTATNEQSTVYFTTSITAGNPTWSGSAATNGLPGARTRFGSTVWNDRIYVVGGRNGSATDTNTIYVSPKLSAGGNITSAWTTSTSFNVAREGAAVTSYANNLYLFGGYDGTNYLSDSQFAPIGYKTGTISQSGTTLIGTGTTWTSGQVGSTVLYSDGSSATITGFNSATSLTVDASKTVASGSSYAIDDGSVGVWTYSATLPGPVRDAQALSANGYIYLVGGRTAAATCAPQTLWVPVSANTTIITGNNPTGIGEWAETNVRYTGDRYGAAVAYSEGKIYTMGGGCTSPLSSNRHYESTVKSQPQVAKYSRLIDTDTNVFPNSWLLNGLDNSIGARWQTSYRSSVDASNVVFHESFDDGTNNVAVQGTEDAGTNSDYSNCYNNSGSGTATRTFDNGWSVTEALSIEFDAAGGTGSTACDIKIDPVSTAATRFDRFYIDFSSNPASNTVIYNVEDAAGGDIVAELRITTSGTLQLRDRFTAEDTLNLGTGTHRIEVGIVNDQMTVRVYSGANLHTSTVSDSGVIDLDLGSDVYDEINFGILTSVDTWSFNLDEHKASQSDWVGSVFPAWGQETNYGDVTLGDVAPYVPLDESGTDTDFARWYFFKISIDASRTFGYPEDVNRGPTISDLNLFFTSDPNKRLRHGKTFTGGQQQPLDTPPPAP